MAASFALGLCAIYLLYQVGFPGTWTFDDWLTLSGLTHVSDWQSAITYIFGNNTGPTGRPLSMLTFLANLDDEGHNPAGFRQINTLVHMANVLLVAGCTWLISRDIPLLSSRATGFAVTLALIWGLHPLLASTVLSVVQRMALLSGSFVLLGILGFLIGRDRLFESPRKGLAIILSSLSACLLLGTFSKENAALLPSFIGLLELLILSRYRPVQLPHWQAFAYVLLWGPILLFAAYIVYTWPNIQAAQAAGYRAFDWEQRIWSELLILWDYVRQIWIPDIRSMGPMQDDPARIHGLDAFSLAAALGWLLAITGSYLLRKRYPVLIFGLAFFLVGHLIESSFIQLELYYEHRNYIPSLGLLAIPLTVLWISNKTRLRLIVLVGVLPLLSLLLFLTTRGWGNPAIGAERWYQAHPSSNRAIHHKVTIMESRESTAAAAHFLVNVSNQFPENSNIAALTLKLQCKANDKINILALLDRIENLIDRSPPRREINGLLGSLEEIIATGNCSSLYPDHFLKIFHKLLKSPVLTDHAIFLARVHVAMGIIQFKTGNIQECLKSFHQGFSLHKNYRTFGYYTGLLRALGRETEAAELRNDFLQMHPEDIFRQDEHRRRVLDAYENPKIQIKATSSESILDKFMPPRIPSDNSPGVLQEP